MDDADSDADQEEQNKYRDAWAYPALLNDS